MKEFIAWFEHLLAHLRHHDNPEAHAAPAEPLPPAPVGTAELVASAHTTLVPTAPAAPASALPLDANDMTRRMLEGEAAANNQAGVTASIQATAQLNTQDTVQESSVFDAAVPSSPRMFRITGAGTVSKTYTALGSGTLELKNGDSGGNVAEYVDVLVTGPGVSKMFAGVRASYQTWEVEGIQAGQTYTIMVTAPQTLAMSVRAELKPA